MSSKLIFATLSLLLVCANLAQGRPPQNAKQNGFRLKEILKQLMTKQQAPPQDYDLADEQQKYDLANEEQDYALSNEFLANEQEHTPGVTYTRFGKASCRKGAELVYEGVVAGSHYTHRGGGSNYLCLPEDPEYSDKVRPGTQGHSYLYGTEYESPLRAEVHDHNVPCAVCYVSSRSTTLMVPAKITCPDSFSKEYDGFLMSDHIGHFRTEFVCVDKDQDVARGTHANTNGALMYHVEANCDTGIDCFPYRKDRELSCVVCSR